MLRSVSAAVLVATIVTHATPAASQRANENAVASAGDAFGNSVGNERIGLYGVGDVRGFSPIQAGNIRIEGLSVTEHGGITNRVTSGSVIRVGLTAQSYPFPAPTGIADYSLRTAGDELTLSPILSFGPNRTAAFELDAEIPIVPGSLSLAAGVSARFDEPYSGEMAEIEAIGGVLRWRARDDLEIKSFFGRMDSERLQQGLIFSGGAYLPPEVERGYYGLDWTESRVSRQFYGSVGTARLTDNWDVRAGLFRWEDDQELSNLELFRDVQPDGSARRSLVATKDQGAESTSGEVRSSYSIIESGRRHTIHLALRGRHTQRAYGGACLRDLGSANIGEKADVSQPQCDFGPLTRDEVNQFAGGVSYQGMWQGIGELSLGIQKTDYRKSTALPGASPITSTGDPWLYNGTLALRVTSELTVYAGYTRGLEESGVAPANAVNRNSAPAPLQTSQRDAGLRYALMPNLTLVAGVFDVRKPYFNLDLDRIYRGLGDVRHQGIELSLAGQPIEGLTVLAGAVLLDADVSGEAVDLGIIGPKAVGIAGRTLRANLDYRLPFFDPVSVDLGILNIGRRVASPRIHEELGEQLTVPGRTTFDLGLRYRFRWSDAPATLRVQVANLFDVNGWDVSSNSSFRLVSPRRLLLSLAADF